MAKARPGGVVLHLIDQLEPLGEIGCRRFFGGWALTRSGTMFAMVIGDRLYFRVDDALRDALRAEGSVPFTYAKGTGRVTVERFYTAPDACLDDTSALSAWADRAVAANPD